MVNLKAHTPIVNNDAELFFQNEKLILTMMQNHVGSMFGYHEKWENKQYFELGRMRNMASPKLRNTCTL